MDGGCFRISPGGDAAVRARLRPAAEDALFVPPDDLAAAEVYRVPDRHLMPAAAQLRRKVGGEGRLQLYPPAARPLPARRVQRLLRVHEEVQRVRDDLHMPLRLHEGPHHAEGADGPAPLRQKAGDYRVVRPLARRHAVGRGRVQAEVAAPVVQGDARPRYDDAGAEAHVVGL